MHLKFFKLAAVCFGFSETLNIDDLSRIENVPIAFFNANLVLLSWPMKIYFGKF